MPGQIVHIEIPADDTRRGASSGLALRVAVPGVPRPVRVPHDPDRRPAGRGDHQHGARQEGTRAYFDVEDINAGAARVKELGGKADDPQAVPNMGWFATCKDPQGNEFGLWQNDPSAQAPAG